MRLWLLLAAACVAAIPASAQDTERMGLRQHEPQARDQLAFVALELEPFYAAEAKERQREHGKTAPGRSKETLQADRPEVFPVPQARDQVAKATGGSGRSVQKAKKEVAAKCDTRLGRSGETIAGNWRCSKRKARR
jgi:hypothetical protein